jgi:hypothetical protein
MSEGKLNETCSMHVGNMNCICIMLWPVEKGHPECHVHRSEVKVCVPTVYKGRYSCTY